MPAQINLADFAEYRFVNLEPVVYLFKIGRTLIVVIVFRVKAVELLMLLSVFVR